MVSALAIITSKEQQKRSSNRRCTNSITIPLYWLVNQLLSIYFGKPPTSHHFIHSMSEVKCRIRSDAHIRDRPLDEAFCIKFFSTRACPDKASSDLVQTWGQIFYGFRRTILRGRGRGWPKLVYPCYPKGTYVYICPPQTIHKKNIDDMFPHNAIRVCCHGGYLPHALFNLFPL